MNDITSLLNQVIHQAFRIGYASAKNSGCDYTKGDFIPIRSKDDLLAAIREHRALHKSSANNERKHAHYFKDVSNFDEMDTYLFCRVWKIQDDSGALHHALKKMMDAGKRGNKDKIKDIAEARDTLNRYLEIEAMFSE